MIKAIIFDMDGTLVDSEYRAMMNKKKILEKNGVVWNHDLWQLLTGRKLKVVIDEVLTEYTPEQRQEVLDEYYKPEYHHVDYHAIKFPGSGTILQALNNNGYKLALCTTNSYDCIDQCLEENHWRRLFSVILGMGDVEHTKPAPDIYLKAMELLDVKPEETVIVEDSRIGLDAAIATGAHVICREEKRFPVDQQGAEFYITDLLSIMRIVNELNEKEI